MTPRSSGGGDHNPSVHVPLDQPLSSVGGEGGPELAGFLGFQPAARQSHLPLPRRHAAEPLHAGVVERHRRDAVAPEPDVDSGGILERAREGLVGLAPADGQRQQRFVVRFDLGGQHAGGRRRGGGGIGARFKEHRGDSAEGRGAGAGGADHAAADHGQLG